MKMRTWVTLVIAAVLGLATARLGVEMVRSARASRAGAGVRTVPVAVAARAMAPGEVLAEGDVVVREMPAVGVPEGAVADAKSLVGRVTGGAVAKGQVMFEGLLAPPGSDGSLRALVPAGMRAITVEVSESSGLAGLVSPGNRVDVIATLRRGEQTVTRTIVEDVKVTAVGQKMSSDAGGLLGGAASKEPGTGVRTVTLVVTPVQAEAIELATTSGRPRLVLRGDADDKVSRPEGVRLTQLLGLPDPAEARPAVATVAPAATQPVVVVAPPPPAPAPEEPKRYEIKVIRGGVESSVYFDGADGAPAAGRREQTRQQQQKQQRPVREASAAAAAAADTGAAVAPAVGVVGNGKGF